jgi:proteasome accessory factor B
MADRTERLLNLVICLMASTNPVARQDIQRRVTGYADAPTEAAFERMFERDKEELRSMGIPVETVLEHGGEVQGYRIRQETYALQEIDLTVPERAAIAVAAQVWSQAVVAPVAGTALRKLEAMDAGLEDWAPVDLHGQIQLTAPDAALLPLMAAIRQDRTVRFPYRTPVEDEPHQREISPWGLRSSAGRWFLVGFDHGRHAVRTFRLSRITGPVTVLARARLEQPPDEFDISTSDGSASPDANAVTSVLRVTPGHGAALRRLATSSTSGGEPLTADVITVTAASIDELAALVCAAGRDVLVIAPESLISAVASSLASVLAVHGSGER